MLFTLYKPGMRAKVVGGKGKVFLVPALVLVTVAAVGDTAVAVAVVMVVVVVTERVKLGAIDSVSF